jgi:hypothetical protein
MPSAISKRTTKTTRIKHVALRVAAKDVGNAPGGLESLRRQLKALGAVRTTPAMKRRLKAAGAWGMPRE